MPFQNNSSTNQLLGWRLLVLKDSELIASPERQNAYTRKLY